MNGFQKYGAARSEGWASEGSRPGPYDGQGLSAGSALPGGDPGAGGADEITTLWVGNLPGETTDRDLLNEFVNFGSVLSAVVSQRPAASGARSGFVRFGTREEAGLALAASLAGQLAVGGTYVTCQWARANSFGGISGGMASSSAGAAPQAPASEQEPCRVCRGAGCYECNETGMDAVYSTGQVQQSQHDFDDEAQKQAYEAFEAEITARATVQVAQEELAWAEHQAQLTATAARASASLASASNAPWRRPAGDSAQANALEGLAVAAHEIASGESASGGEITTLWLGNLPQGSTEDDVTMGFFTLGQWQVLATSVNRRASQGVLSGFIRFLHRVDAEQALMWVTAGNVVVNGVAIQAKWARNNSRMSNAYADAQAHQPPQPHRPPQPQAIGQTLLGGHGTAAAAAAASSAFARIGGGVGGGGGGGGAAPLSWSMALSSSLSASSLLTRAGASPLGFTSANVSSGGVRTLFVGSVPFDATEADVVLAFAQVGLEGIFSLNTTGSNSKGNSGFMRFESPTAAAEAVIVCNAAKPMVRGQEIMVALAKADSR